jgi:hypothetical protein
MLSFTALTQTVFDVLDAGDYREWARISDEINTAESAELVYYQCRRALEDAPGHPGLLTLVALALEGMQGDRKDEIVAFLLAAAASIHTGFSMADQQAIHTWTVGQLQRISATSTSILLDQVLQQGRDSVLAGVVLRGMAEGSLPNDPILRRTSQRCILKSIDDRLDDFLIA